MRLTLAQLPAQLERGLAPLYVIGGEEPLLAQEAADAIRVRARALGYAEREVLDAERDFEWNRLLDSCNAMSLFASLRIVELRLAQAPDVTGGRLLQQLAAKPPQDVLLLIHVPKLEWRTRSGGWFTALETAGASLYFEPLKPAEMPGWIAARLRAAGLDADPEALALLAERTEGHLLAAKQEIDKLALLTPPGSRLDLERIDSAVADSVQLDIFGWIARVLAGDAVGAVRGLDLLRAEGHDLVPINLLLAGSLRTLLGVCRLLPRAGSGRAAAEAARIRRASVAEYAAAAERASVNQVLGWLKRSARIDALAKQSGGQQQAWEELLTLTTAASGAATRKAAAGRR